MRCIVVAAVVLSTHVVHAEPADRLVFSDFTLLRANPLLLETRARFGLQLPLYDRTLAGPNYGFVGVYPVLGPASARLGLGGELQPLAVFHLRAFVEAQQYFGVLGSLQSFATPSANYSDDRQRELRGSAYASWLIRLSLQPTLKARVGPVAVRSHWQLDYWAPKLRDGDTVAYEPTLDTLVPDDGWTVAADTDVLYAGIPRLAVGIRHSWAKPLYRREHFRDAFDQAAYDDDNAYHRLGVTGAYALRARPRSAFHHPTIVVDIAWYLQHRWRTGRPDHTDISGAVNNDDFITRAMPYLLVGFGFESDFYPAR